MQINKQPNKLIRDDILTANFGDSRVPSGMEIDPNRILQTIQSTQDIVKFLNSLEEGDISLLAILKLIAEWLENH